MIPYGAQGIIDLRLRGVKPVDAVVVSTLGRVFYEQPVVQADPQKPYDWRWLRDLDVMVLTVGKPCGKLLQAILEEQPGQVFLCDESRRKAFYVTRDYQPEFGRWKPGLIPCSKQENEEIFQ